MRRALAIIGAVVMVAMAFVVRSWRADGGGSDPRPDPGDRAATIVCVTELSSFCTQLRTRHPNLTIVTEDAGRTYATVIGADFDATRSRVDAWLAPAAWATMADEARQRNGAPDATADPTLVGRSPLVLVIWQDRQVSLDKRCGGTTTWRCVGEVAGTAWSSVDDAPGVRAGDVRPGLEPVATSGIGLLVAGQAVSSYFGRTDFASQDLDDEGEQRWQSQLRDAADAASTGRVPLDQMLSLGPATFDLAGTTEAAAAAVATSRDKDRLRVLYPAPLATADLAITSFLASPEADAVRDLLTSDDTAELLTTFGWRVAGRSLPPTARADLELPATDGLPRPGVLDALRTRW